MFCIECGKEIDEGSDFCTNCGAKGGREVSEGIPITVPKAISFVKAKGRKPINKKYAGIIGGAVGILIILIIIISVMSGRVSADKYINDEIEFYGYNGFATVSVDEVYDYDALINDLGKNDYADTKSQILNSIVEKGSDFLTKELITIEFDKSENLNNGDEITATIKINYATINAMKFDKKLVGKDVFEKTYTVSGLEETVVIDPFEIIASVDFDLVDRTASINYNNEYNKTFGEYSVRYIQSEYSTPELEIIDADKNTITHIYYNTDSDAYSSTKKITVNAEIESEDYADRGIVISPIVKEYKPLTCDYLTNADDIKQEDFEKLKERAVSEINNKDGKLLKTYFLYDKNGTQRNNTFNEIVFVYAYNNFFGYNVSDISVKNVKIDNNKDLVDIDSLYFYRTSGTFESLKDLEADLKDDGWTTVSIIKADK